MLLDANNRPHRKAKGDFRIVSLVPSITELLFDLGLKESVVGRTPFCVHPANEVKNVPKVGGTKTVDIEKIMSVSPTHVILNIDENKVELFNRLCRKGVEIIVTHPNRPEDNLELFDLLGYVFSCEVTGENFSSALKEKLHLLTEKSTRLEMKKVLYLIWRDPWMTVSNSTYISNMLKLIRWKTVPISTEPRYPELSVNELAELKFDLCLLSSEPYPFRSKHIEEIKKIRDSNGEVILVDGEKLSWYGSRALKGLDYLLTLMQLPVNTEDSRL